MSAFNHTNPEVCLARGRDGDNAMAVHKICELVGAEGASFIKLKDLGGKTNAEPMLL